MNLLLLSLMLFAVAAAFKIRRAEAPVLYGFGKADTMPLRGLLALVVMFSHLDTKTQFAVPALHFVHWATPAVAVFFFLSGYGLVKSHAAAESSGRLPGYWPAFWKRSLARLLVPLLVVGTLWAATRFFVQDLPLHVFIRRLPRFVLHPPFAWYVWAQLAFYGFFFLSFRFFGRRWRVAAVCVMTLAYFLVMKYAIGTIVFYWITSMSFAVGVVFSTNEEKVRAAVLKFPVSIYLSVAVTAAAFLAVREFGFWRIPTREAFHLVIGPSFALLFYAFEWLRRVRPLAFVGAVSYEVYLLHGVVLKNLLPLGWPPVIAVGAVVLVTIALSVVLKTVCGIARKS